MRIAVVLILCLFVVPKAYSLGPHEVVLLVNSNSDSSVRIAEHYAKIRKIPALNIIRLSLPKTYGDSTFLVSPKAFTDQIWTPVTKAIKTRGLDAQVLAWIYSSGFPTGIKHGGTAFSITGLTFLRNQIVDPDVINKARYASPVFAGPIALYKDVETSKGPARKLQMTDRPPAASASLDWLTLMFNDRMPLPAMMLGVVGQNGNTEKEVISYLTRSATADSTSPKGTVLLVKTADRARSEPREWQFEPARKELASMGIACEILDGWPKARVDLIGLMTGLPKPKPKENDYLPGAFADHLTSFAANYGVGAQVKCSAWFKEGVAGSAGTVVEPFAIWVKFPHARVYVHYASGCTLLESLVLSVSCPLQLLYLGDPLCQPWAPKAPLRVTDASGGDGTIGFRATVQAEDAYAYTRVMVLVDGRLAGSFPLGSKMIELKGQSPGVREVRVIAYRNGRVRFQSFADVSVLVK